MGLFFHLTGMVGGRSTDAGCSTRLLSRVPSATPASSRREQGMTKLYDGLGHRHILFMSSEGWPISIDPPIRRVVESLR